MKHNIINEKFRRVKILKETNGVNIDNIKQKANKPMIIPPVI